MAQPSISLKDWYSSQRQVHPFCGRTHALLHPRYRKSRSQPICKILNKAWYYLDSNGYAVTGLQTIDGKQYYFDTKVVRLKDTLSLSITNVTSLMAIVVKLPVHVLTENNKWYYVDGNGKLVKKQGAR